jgi:hypothetical protein
MASIISLQDYVTGDYIPAPKDVPTRSTEKATLDCEEKTCPFCGEQLQYWFLTPPRTLIFFKCDLELRVVFLHCVNDACPACQEGRGFYNPALDAIALPRRHLTLEVILQIGHLIFQEDYSEDDVAQYLRDEYGIQVCQPTVSNYKKVCLALGEALLAGNAAAIKAALEAQLARVYSVDGVSSNKSKTLFIIRELLSGVVLGAAILDEHDAKAIGAFMERVCERFGRPDFWVGDGQAGLIGAARELYPGMYQYCHRHFLSNLGKALMEGTYEELKKSLTARASSSR